MERKTEKNYFFNNKVKPSKWLKEVLKYAPKMGYALDIGAGNGVGSIFLAQNGFKVDAIDKNAESLKNCNSYAKKNNLAVKIENLDIRRFKFPKEKYSLIISVTALDFLKLTEIKKILKKIKKALKEDGIFYLAVFSTKDPSFKISKQAGFKMIEKNTFYFPKIKATRHYFEKEELRDILKDLKIIKFKEIFKKQISKTDHFHNSFQIIVKK